MMQSVGWNNDIWIKRLKCIGFWWTTAVIALFIAEAVVFTVRAHTQDFDTQMAEWKAEHNNVAAVCNQWPCEAQAPCKTPCNTPVCADCPNK